MTAHNVCPVCDSAELRKATYDECLALGKKKIVVTGLRRSLCGACGSELVSEEELAHNVRRTEEAVLRTPGVMTAGLLRTLRERWNLTQRQASKLFGAGESSFAKWESEQNELSGPAALLVQCAFSVQGVMEHLAALHGMTIARVDGLTLEVSSEPMQEPCYSNSGNVVLIYRSSVAGRTAASKSTFSRSIAGEMDYAGVEESVAMAASWGLAA